jgi:hypothetical protein
MGRPSHVCTTCSEHFTRRYSATRHNNNLHNGAAEIVRLIDYLAGRSSGQYLPTIHPSWYKRSNPSHNFGPATVADRMGNDFQPRFLPQQAPLGTSQYYTSPLHQLPPTMHETFGRGLSQETKRKIDELTRLMNKYPQFHTNPDGIRKLAIHNCINGDNTFVDEKLEQLHIIDLYRG